MKMKYFVVLLGLLAGTVGQSKVFAGGKKKAAPVIKVLEATSQKTIPGIPGADIKTDYHFLIVWSGTKYPETFFWRGENGWLTCNMQKAHKTKKGYSTEFASGDKIHNGDTLDLKPIRGGKFPIPAEIPVDAKNTLYYKTGGSGWLAFPVKSITKKPDIVQQ